MPSDLIAQFCQVCSPAEALHTSQDERFSAHRASKSGLTVCKKNILDIVGPLQIATQVDDIHGVGNERKIDEVVD